MHPALRYAFIWLALCLALSLGFVIASDPEPACQGPLIYDTDDSFPLQCNGLLDGLRRMMPIIAFGSAVLTWLAGATAWLIRRLRPAPA